ncbi:hypothetical protein GBAR_LOCUS19135, partial [Geodia barretti]
CAKQKRCQRLGIEIERQDKAKKVNYTREEQQTRMNLSIVFYLTPLLTFTNGGKLLEFSYTREVNEGEWASFSCAVKRGKAIVRWKIGNYTDEVGNGMKYIGSHGLVVRQYDDRELTEKYKGKGLTSGVEVLATAELNRVPVQCVAHPLDLSLSIEYSKFIILSVHADLNTTNQDTISQDLPRPRNSRSVTSPPSSSSRAAALFTSTFITITLVSTTILTLDIS